ncbi:hypothetical protein mRhiFer1_010253 [Rhinolophus ferrumequinum]|uniref:Uncharacterized protein n=1 Tax=Rhinolophus ferrumequinum TaxID=59479 RepID=A0A7J7X5A3_RHIFE|nr:hypothetical protein mRhiFer1_010253 [Rhinolophus ferrumequinum]
MLYILLSCHHSHIPPWKVRVLNCDILRAGGGYGCCKKGDTAASGHGEATLGHTAVRRGRMGLVIPDINHVTDLAIPDTNVPSERHVPSEKCGLRGGGPSVGTEPGVQFPGSRPHVERCSLR